VISSIIANLKIINAGKNNSITLFNAINKISLAGEKNFLNYPVPSMISNAGNNKYLICHAKQSIFNAGKINYLLYHVKF
jgi:hypothetical protein